MANILEVNGDKTSQSPSFAITNFSAKTDLDANTAALADVADELCTLIRELIRRGIIHGTIA